MIVFFSNEKRKEEQKQTKVGSKKKKGAFWMSHGKTNCRFRQETIQIKQRNNAYELV